MPLSSPSGRAALAMALMNRPPRKRGWWRWWRR